MCNFEMHAHAVLLQTKKFFSKNNCNVKINVNKNPCKCKM